MTHYDEIEHFAGGGRISPQYSATIPPTGTLGIGNNGDLWINKEDKNGTKSWRPAVKKALFRDLVFDTANNEQAVFVLGLPQFILKIYYLYDHKHLCRIDYKIYDERDDEVLKFEAKNTSIEKSIKAFIDAWQRDEETFKRHNDENDYIRVKTDVLTLLGILDNLKKEGVLRPFKSEEEETPEPTPEEDKGADWLEKFLRYSKEVRKTGYPKEEYKFWDSLFESSAKFERTVSEILRKLKRNDNFTLTKQDILNLKAQEIVKVSKEDAFAFLFFVATSNSNFDKLVGKKYYDGAGYLWELENVNYVLAYDEAPSIPKKIEARFKITNLSGNVDHINKKLSSIELYYLSQNLTGVTEYADDFLREEKTNWAYGETVTWKDKVVGYVAKKGDTAKILTREMWYDLDNRIEERPISNLNFAYRVEWLIETTQEDGLYDENFFELKEATPFQKINLQNPTAEQYDTLIKSIRNNSDSSIVITERASDVFIRITTPKGDENLKIYTLFDPQDNKIKLLDQTTGKSINSDEITNESIEEISEIYVDILTKLVQEIQWGTPKKDCEADPTKIVSGQVKKFYDSNKTRIEKLNPLISCKIIQALVSLSEYEECGVGSSESLPKAKSDLLSRISKLKV